MWTTQRTKQNKKPCVTDIKQTLGKKRQGVISAFKKWQGLTKKGQGAAPCKNGLRGDTDKLTVIVM